MSGLPCWRYKELTSFALGVGIRCIVTLECTEARAEGATPSRYVTQKVMALKRLPESLQGSFALGCCKIWWPANHFCMHHMRLTATGRLSGRIAQADLRTFSRSSCQEKGFLLQNRKKTSERLELRKYNKFLRRHTLHKVFAHSEIAPRRHLTDQKLGHMLKTTSYKLSVFLTPFTQQRG